MQRLIPVLAAFAAVVAMGAPVAAETTIRASIAIPPSGPNGDGASSNPGISRDARFVVFASKASNLVPDDTNGAYDVFVRDLTLETTERVSVAGDGTQANAGSFYPAISGDGRFVVFVSEATNLVPGDTNGVDDIYVHDRTTGSTRRMSISRRGKEPDAESFSPAISANGRWIAFTSGATTLVRGDTNGEYDVFVRDRTRRTIRRVSVSSAGTEGTGFSDRGSFSANGRYVAFHSTSEDLVPGDTNGVMDIFLRDQLKQRTRRISLTPSGGQVDGASSTPTLSANARYVAFDSSATDLVPGDANGTYDVFLRDRRTRTTTIVSVRSGGDAANGGSSFPGTVSIAGPALFYNGKVVQAASLFPGFKDRKSTRLNSSHVALSRMPSSA